MIPTPALDADLYATIRRMACAVSKGLDPEDVAQATALKMVRGRLLDRWRAERGSIEAYLFVIARSVATSMRRTRYRRRRADVAYRADVVTSNRLRQEAWVRDLLASRHVHGWRRDVEQRLSPPAREAFWLLLEGASRADVATHVRSGRRERVLYREITEVARSCRS